MDGRTDGLDVRGWAEGMRLDVEGSVPARGRSAGNWLGLSGPMGRSGLTGRSGGTTT